MKNIDLSSLEPFLSRSDLNLKRGYAKSAEGSERLDDAPTKVGFFWYRDSEQVYSIELEKNELNDLIKNLESRNISVPAEFYEAFKDFQN